MQCSDEEEPDFEYGDRGELAPGTLVGSYRIERALAEGGMAMIYEAVHTILKRHAAIKVMHKFLEGKWATRERLLQEARILDAIDHPGVVRIYEAGELADGRAWLAMELIEGVTLSQRITVHGALDALEVVNVLAETAGALAAAHAGGVVHRDLKPENLILTRKDGRLAVKVIDWGIARIEDEADRRLTRQNMTPGTPYYMSPEQARGKPVDGRSDIYTLGVIATEALTGALPFEGDSALDVVVKHLTAEPPTLRSRMPELPEALDRLVLAMLRKDPAMRPSLEQVQERLEALAVELREEEISVEIEIDVDVDDDEPAPSPRMRWTPNGVPSVDEDGVIVGEIVLSQWAI
jgi:serine/threonine protein kinase